MGKVRKRYNRVPLWLALFLMITAALLIAALGSHFTSTLARGKADEIQSRYITATFDGTQGDVQYSYDFDFHYEDYTAEDMRLYRITRFIENYAALFWYSVCIASAGIVFYMTKLKKPLRILNNASQRTFGWQSGIYFPQRGGSQYGDLKAASGRGIGVIPDAAGAFCVEINCGWVWKFAESWSIILIVRGELN